MRSVPRTVVLALAAAATVVSCSFSAGSDVTVDKDKVAQEVSNQLKQQVGRAPESVECPNDLDGKVGTEMRCTLNDSGETYGVTITVTKVDGTNVKFGIKVDDEPR